MVKRELQPSKGKEVFYVGVKSPSEIRRTVLETSRDMVQYLQRYEKFKEIKEEKRKAITKLRDDMRDVKSLVNKLKKVLPKTKLRIKISELHPDFQPKKKTKKKNKKKKRHKQKIKEEAPKKMTEIERLENELSAIEGRLKSI